MYLRVMFMTTFWGFEQPTHLPPNIVLVGPTLRENSDDFVDRLKTAAPDLLNWIEKAKDGVIYITLGSEVEWQQWYIDSIFGGIELAKKNGIAVKAIWAIKSKTLTLPSGYDKDTHWVSDWLP